MTVTITQPDLEKAKLNLETSQIPWQELQRFFASGSALFISPELDMVDVAYQMSVDNAQQIEHWLTTKQIAPVSDAQALTWYETDATVWAVVVKPWILIQE
ncbi:MAG: DUF2288 domain-containing protein [Methylomicrobium sp.]